MKTPFISLKITDLILNDHQYQEVYGLLSANFLIFYSFRNVIRTFLDIYYFNPKTLLTLDDDPPADYSGIRRINALDWLLDK